ncbi:CaiB/BaiF CoA-transferase family protein [Pseudomonas lopnurensis]|uniref:CaiB/BaiF CoA-transferase family protein n=1 Tax=Pseudomonas lopnurensis TaxID=1477517 RepID=UPI0028AD66C1|nr:CoA transferase [Pseudomonas lopnurensis]
MSSLDSTTAARHESLPLIGLRVVELANGKTDMAGRMLADLGAEVILVEPPQGLAVRRQAPLHQGVSLYFATHHANKSSLVLDLDGAEGRSRFDRLLASADLLIDGSAPGYLAGQGFAADELLQRHPRLTLLSVSDFGLSGPYRDFQASSAVHTAMAGVLCRSGKPGLAPLLPPGALALESAAVQQAWVALLGHWQCLQRGVGDHLDFSIYETIAQVMDPALGVTGSAQAGKSALDSTPHGRPPAVPLYPILPCKDGHVRLCVLNPRQWEAMRDWLGPDHEFCDPAYMAIGKRMMEAKRINALIAELFSRYDAKELVSEGQRRGVPMAAVATPAEVLLDEHFNARGVFIPLRIDEGVEGRVPAGYLEVDGRRAGIRQGAPGLGADNQRLLDSLAPVPAGATDASAAVRSRRPLEGVRVLDLGVIVAGAEGGRILADQGAEVIKIENRAFPDGGRQSQTGLPMTPSIAQGHRNKQSIGINLRSERGRELFKQLVAQSDVVLSNFKPGTLESLGLGYEVLKQVNPRIVMMDSSALGNTGPLSRSLGYGPLVRASTGLASVWRYPDIPDFYGDGVTIYPDHLAARVAAVGVLALLIRRERTSLGGTVSLSQAEIFINGNAEHFLRESLEPGSFVAHGNVSEFAAPDGIYPCAGEDEWCAVSVRDDHDWQRLLEAIGRTELLDETGLSTMAGRIARRAQVDALVSEWTQRRTPREVTEQLQAVGIPAGFMQRLSEYRDDPQFKARNFIRSLEHEGLPESLPTENRVVHAASIPDPELRPAPYQGEHTRIIAERLLGLSMREIDELIAAGDLEDMQVPAA